MKKIRVILVLAICAALSIAGCAQNTAAQANTAAQQAAETAAQPDIDGVWYRAFEHSSAGTASGYAVMGGADYFDFLPDGKLTAKTSDASLEGDWTISGSQVTLNIDGKSNTGYLLKDNFLVLFDGDRVTGYARLG